MQDDQDGAPVALDEPASAQAETAAEPLTWVGVGASAGGLEAIRAMVSSLPEQARATYIIVQHLAPQHRSLLAELISRETHLRVEDVVDGLSPQPNGVYVTPPNADVVVQGDRLRLLSPSKVAGAPKPSVDRFFRSLAEEVGDRAVGVILSGTGSDGAHGVQMIRAAGGVTIAQSEETAKYNGMVRAATETNCVDLVLSPQEIGGKFAEIIRTPRNLDGLQTDETQSDAFTRILSALRQRHGVDFRHYKPATLIRRIDRLMIARGIGAVSDYGDLLERDPLEVDALFRDLLISVTSFFRDREEYAALQNAIEELTGKNPSGPLRIWVAGCATGEEAYSVAMLVADAFGGPSFLKQRAFQIFATDLDEQALDKARRGVYTAEQASVLSQERLAHYFERTQQGYAVLKPLRDLVVFSNHNVCQDPPFLNLDIVTCRNLLIYLQPSMQSTVLRRFHYALKADGILFLGKSESVSIEEDLFRPGFGAARVFRRRHASSQTRRAPVEATTRRDFQRMRAAIEADKREARSAYAMFDGLARSIGPDALLVTRDLSIRRSYGELRRYLAPSEGEMRASVDTLVAPQYRQEIRSLVRVADHRGERRAGMLRAAGSDAQEGEQILVYPVDRAADGEGLFLVVFRRRARAAELPAMQVGDEGEELTRVRALEKELEVTRDNLQSVVEAQETTNEELQAFVEELQSSNEELQSTNEELETSNEELESTNEELTTVNEELVIKTQELTMANQDMDSILTNIASPILVVDREHYVRRCSDQAAELFEITPMLTPTHISQCRAGEGFPDLGEMLGKVLGTGSLVELDIAWGERRWRLRAAPYHDKRGALLGAVFVFSDTSALVRSREALEQLLAALPVGVTVRDADGVIKSASPRALRNFGVEAGDAVGRTLSDFIDGPAARAMEDEDRRVLEAGRESRDVVQRIQRRDGSSILLRVNRAPFHDPDDGVLRVLSVGLDVTTEAEAVAALRDREERFKLAVEGGSIGLWDWDLRSDALYWSPRFKQILGLADSEDVLRVEAFFDRLHPEDVPRVREAVDGHLKRGEPYEVEYRMRREDGSDVWIVARGAAQRRADGTPIRFLGTVEDFTERRNQAAALAERNALMTMAQQLSKVGHWRYDTARDALFWSSQVYEIHGLPADGPAPSVAEALACYHPDDRRIVERAIGGALERREPYDVLARLVRADGETRLTRSIGRCEVDGDGDVTAVFGVFQDITAQAQRQEELLHSNSELERFSYACSHELKEPVRLISTLSGLLLDGGSEMSDAERDEALARIQRNSARLSELVSDLVSYARIDGERETGPVDLNAILAESQEALALRFAESGAELICETLPSVDGAGFHFRQLFQNLLANALLHGGPELSVIKVSAQDGGAVWRFSVEDDGVGVPEEGRADLFEAFNRRHKDGRGTGLGLWICAKIVVQYGGRIWCESSPLGGAAFIVETPKR